MMKHGWVPPSASVRNGVRDLRHETRASRRNSSTLSSFCFFSSQVSFFRHPGAPRPCHVELHQENPPSASR